MRLCISIELCELTFLSLSAIMKNSEAISFRCGKMAEGGILVYILYFYLAGSEYILSGRIRI